MEVNSDIVQVNRWSLSRFKMNKHKNNTLSRIQNEIKENLEREKELKNGHSIMNGNNPNGALIIEPKGSNSSGFRRFIPNTNTKGVMQKFFKSRGKLSLPAYSNGNSIDDAAFQPAKIVVEKGKPLRNGYVPAKEKIVKELLDFQLRETELRNERIKSQSDLMAALELEDSCESEWGTRIGDTLKPGKSMSCLYQPEDDEVLVNNHSAPSSLKPSRSLAALCDLSDEEIDVPGTHSLIMQFENMKTKETST
ncbi:hypothetical protein JTB14_007859 [Gonioctena quinquepunctata]|nr:hypothetical protein JTB14_007859 [Gonioctena quinquepunctata]